MRDAAFRFTNGQFTLIGLAVDGWPLPRAYSLKKLTGHILRQLVVYLY
jgi:ferredoxin-NADP reductase